MSLVLISPCVVDYQDLETRRRGRDLVRLLTTNLDTREEVITEEMTTATMMKTTEVDDAVDLVHRSNRLW